MRHKLATFAAGALALMTKHLTLPLVWCWFVYSTSPRRAALWMIAALALWLITFAPTLLDGAGRIVERVFLYHSWPYGFQSPLLFYMAIILLPFVARWLHLDLLDALLFTALGQMVFVHGAGSNNFYPVLLFGSARPSRWLIALSISIVLLVSPWTQLETMIGGFNTNNLSWLICMAWFVSMIVMKLQVMRHMPPNGGKIMKRLFVFLFIVAAIVLPLVSVVPAAAAGDDSNCCANPGAIYCYACKVADAPLSTADQVTPGIDSASYYQLRGVVASQALGKTVNITDYGRYSVRDGNDFVDISARDRMRVSAITVNGLDIK